MNRALLLYGGLAATLVAVWYSAGLETTAGDDDLQAAVRPAPRPGVAPAPMPAPPPGPGAALTAPPTRMGDERLAAPRSPVMGVRDWRPPPPPPPPVVAAVEAPRAPPLPFRYLGRLDDERGTQVFLSEGNQPRAHVVRVGDRLRDYQVESIGPQGMALIYLPLNQKQQLLFGSAP